jgi:hypothetical protein
MRGIINPVQKLVELSGENLLIQPDAFAVRQI